MIRVRSFLLLFSLLALLPGAGVHAAVDSQAIAKRVDEFMQEHVAQLLRQYGDSTRVEYNLSSIDPRLAMADCPNRLQALLRGEQMSGRINIKVSCDSQNRWSLYVPVDVSLYRKVISSRGPIARNSVISADQLELREMNVSSLKGSYFTESDDIIGMQARRLIRADEIITTNQLQQPLMIKRGEAVQMTAQSGGLTVKIPGVALADGRKGEQISVRNKQSKRVVEARVAGPGQVLIPM